jgi:hypothetical protein
LPVSATPFTVTVTSLMQNSGGKSDRHSAFVPVGTGLAGSENVATSAPYVIVNPSIVSAPATEGRPAKKRTAANVIRRFIETPWKIDCDFTLGPSSVGN